MKNIKAPNFILVILALIIGGGLYGQFDFETLEFEKVGLSIVYALALLGCIYGIVRGYRNQESE